MHNRVTGDVSGTVAQIGTVQGSVHVAVPWIPPTPRELPPPLERFTNRISELDSLERAYRRGSRLVVVMGLGGVGKTSVAVEFAHRIATDFPDGQIVLDLGGGSAAPVPVGEVLSSVLRRLGVGGDALPVSVADRAALLRSLTYGRRLLIVADNAEDTAQIRPLIPATPGSLLLVTSRVRMPALIGNGARWVPVDPLATAGATALLSQLLPDDLTSHPALPALAAVCSGMPLAVCAVADLLSLDPGHSPNTVLSTLTRHYQHHAASGRPLTEVSMYASLESAVAELTPSAQRLYPLLGLHPLTTRISAQAAAVLGDTPMADTARCCTS